MGAWFTAYGNFISGPLAVVLPSAGVVSRSGKIGWYSELGLLMASCPLGMLLGTVFFGRACDRFGRRRTLVATVLLFSLAGPGGAGGYFALADAVGPTAGVGFLIASRFLGGLGIGGAIIVLDVYLYEVMPEHFRGRAIAILQAVAFSAIPAGAALSEFVTPKNHADRWWVLLAVCSAGAGLIYPFLRCLPESPPRLVARRPGPSVPGPTSDRSEAFQVLWSEPYRRRVLLLVSFHVLWPAGYYGFMHWLPSILELKGQARAWVGGHFLPLLLAPAGPLLALWTIDRFDRKVQLVLLALALGVGLVVVGLAANAVTTTAAAAAVALCCNWFCTTFHVYQTELFPPEVRATGAGFSYSWSRASIVVLNYSMPTVMAAGLPLAVSVMAVPMFAAAFVIFAFGPRTTKRGSDEISPVGPAGT